MEPIGHRFDVGLFAGQRSAFADYVEASLAVYRDHGGDHGLLVRQQLDGDESLRLAHEAITTALADGVEAEQLPAIQLELAKGDLTNSTHVMAKSRWVLLVAAYEKRKALIAERDALSLKIQNSGWLELWSRFCRWRINRALAAASGEEELSEKKQRLEQAREKAYRLDQSDKPYEEMLLDIEEMIAGGQYGNLHHTLGQIKELLREIIAIEKKLGAAPSLARLQQIGEEIVRNLRSPPQLVDVETAKKMQKRYNDQLSWAMDDIGGGLESPINWTSIRRVSVKEAQDGTIYATSTVAEPLFDTMIPALTRKKHKELPANGWKETHQIIGMEESKTVGYRIAAFLSDAAANAAFDKIGDVERLHLSSLLTPAWFLTSDSGLLRDQRRRVKAHFDDVIHTNVPVNLHGWIGWWTSNTINQEAFDQYGNDPMVGQVRELWQRNVDWNQFEVAGKLSLLNHLLGITELWHCMSTKDRSSEKDAAAHFYLDEHNTPNGEPLDEAAERHRLAINRRHTALIALSNPQRNTGFAGTKMRIWDGITKYRAGFDTEYVIERVEAAIENKGQLYRELTGADELGTRRAKAVEKEINEIPNNPAALRRHLKRLAEEKALTFKPLTTVKY